MMDEIDYDGMIEKITEIQRSYEHMVAVNQVLRDALVVLGAQLPEGARSMAPDEIAETRALGEVTIERAEDGTITVAIKQKQ